MMLLPCTSHHSWSTPSSTSNLAIEITFALPGAVLLSSWPGIYFVTRPTRPRDLEAHSGHSESLAGGH